MNESQSNENKPQLDEGKSGNEFSKLLHDQANYHDYTKHKAAMAYASIYTRITNIRLTAIKEVDKARGFYLLDTILSQLTEDSLTPEISTGEILNVKSPKSNIQEEIDYLDEKFNFDRLVLDIMPDMLAYGEYILATQVRPVPELSPSEESSEDSTPNKSLHERSTHRLVAGREDLNEEKEYGLLDILDIVEQGTVIPLSKMGGVHSYLIRDYKGGIANREPSEFIRFGLDSQRIRVDLAQEFQVHNKSLKKVFKDIPRFVRVGKSVIWPILSKIKELQLLESLVPATKISKLTSGSIIGVQVPGGFDVENGLEAAKRVENMLNKKVGIDPKLGELNIEDIMSAAGRLKVIPLFGDKGQMERIDIKSEEPDDLLSSIDDLRRVITSSIGIPYELIFGSDGESKGEFLKRYARYLRKLKNIQRAVQEGIRQIIYIHLANKGIAFEPSDILVEFRNKLVEIDNLDKLEFMDTVVGMMDNLKRFVMELAEEESPFSKAVNLRSFGEWMNEQFSIIGFNNILDPRKLNLISQEKSPGGHEDEEEEEGEEYETFNGCV